VEIGIKGRQTVTVDGTNTARVMGSGTLDVFATPSMVALMEETAWKSVEGELEEGSGTVGISLEVTHDAPTPVGMSVTCESELVEIDGRKLSFKIKAYDEKGEIGTAYHKRFIINEEKFLEKAEGKKRYHSFDRR